MFRGSVSASEGSDGIRDQQEGDGDPPAKVDTQRVPLLPAFLKQVVFFAA